MSGSAYYIKLHELVTVIGDDAARKLAAELGGQRIYIQERASEDGRITAIIGFEASKKLSQHIATGIGGLAVELPRAGNATFNAYRLKLRELAASPGLTEAEIAQQLGIHCRTVRRMRAKLRAERNAEGNFSKSLRNITREAGQLSGA